jgi:hypothetical protein
VEHERFAVEVKHRKELPRWIKDAMAQAVRCAAAGQVPVVVLHELGARHDNDLVIIRLGDLEELLQ